MHSTHETWVTFLIYLNGKKCHLNSILKIPSTISKPRLCEWIYGVSLTASVSLAPFCGSLGYSFFQVAAISMHDQNISTLSSMCVVSHRQRFSIRPQPCLLLFRKSWWRTEEHTKANSQMLHWTSSSLDVFQDWKKGGGCHRSTPVVVFSAPCEMSFLGSCQLQSE